MSSRFDKDPQSTTTKGLPLGRMEGTVSSNEVRCGGPRSAVGEVCGPAVFVRTKPRGRRRRSTSSLQPQRRPADPAATKPTPPAGSSSHPVRPSSPPTHQPPTPAGSTAAPTLKPAGPPPGTGTPPASPVALPPPPPVYVGFGDRYHVDSEPCVDAVAFATVPATLDHAVTPPAPAETDPGPPTYSTGPAAVSPNCTTTPPTSRRGSRGNCKPPPKATLRSPASSRRRQLDLSEVAKHAKTKLGKSLVKQTLAGLPVSQAHVYLTADAHLL